MSSTAAYSNISSALETGLHHKNIVIIGGDDMCGFYVAKEMLKRGGMSKHDLRVGYLVKESPFVKELEKEGVEMMKFELNNDESIKRLYEGRHCAVVSPPLATSDFKNAKRVMEIASKCHDLKRCIMMSIMNVDKMRDWDRMAALHDMEKEFQSHMNKWEKAYIVRGTMALEGFQFLRPMIQDKRQFPWPASQSEVTPCSLKDVAKVVHCLLKGGHMIDSDNEEATQATSIISSIGDRLASIVGLTPDSSNHRILNMTGMEKLKGKDLAERCSRALGTRIELKEMNVDEFVKCIMEMNKIPKECMPVFKQLCEAMCKGMLSDQHDDLHKLLNRKPMSVENYFERNRNDFKPSAGN